MTIVTLLDAAHAAVSASPEDETARLRFYERLADGEMFLLLEREAVGDVLDPKVFDLDSGPVVLVFDREERLAEFSGGIAPYAALPGRVVAQMLKGQGIGLGVNLGVAPSEMLLPFLTPAVPEAVVAGLDAKLARAGGLAAAAVLAGVVYDSGRRGHLLAVLDAVEGAEAALARALREALVFSGIEAGELDVAFLRSDEAAAQAMARVGLRFDLPVPEVAEFSPQAPGTDPARPPRLR